MYIYANYNITPSYGEFSRKGNTLMNLINALIELINSNEHLPRFVAVIPDKKIIKLAEASDFDGNMVEIIEKFLTWFVTHCNQVIQFKKEELRSRREGTIEAMEPKIISVAITENPSQEQNENSSIIRRFNSVLEEVLTGFKGNYIIHPFGREVKRSLLDRGVTSFNHEGRVAYWRYINAVIQKFDERKISLKPYKLSDRQKGDKSQAQQSRSTNGGRFLLPRPPQGKNNRR